MYDTYMLGHTVVCSMFDLIPPAPCLCLLVWVMQILASKDLGVKRTRMAFKKSYQGCLNKASKKTFRGRFAGRRLPVCQKQ